MNEAAAMRIASPGVTRALLLGLLMLTSTVVLGNATAFDTDGDGVQDSQDDCPVAAGNSTVDRTGCPDRDGDGTSDKNDPWTIQSGGFLLDAHQSLSGDYYTALFNHNGSQFLTSDEGDYMRIWDTVTRLNLRSVQLSGFGDVSWSPDGTFVAATTSGDELKTYYSSNMTPLFSVSTGGEETHELEYSSDGTMIAVVGARDGGSGNGQVEIFDSMNGSLIHSFEPAGEDQFYSVDWSPDSSRILIGGDEDVWIYNVGGSWTANRSFNTNRGTNNAVAWSPDGNSFATCEAWASSGARVRMFDIASSQEIWVYSTSTSCLDLAWSPDSTQVAASMTYYQSDGASVKIFDADSGSIVDTVSGPRPGGCGSSGGGNSCGSVYGVDWHPNGLYIIGAMGRNDEGLFHWIVDPDIDGDGVLNENDAFPEDGTQWNDTDNDGFGDNLGGTNGDACPDVAGTSTMDRYGCPDTDGDGWSDDGDDFPNDVYQWVDADGDGYPGNTNDNRDPSPYGELDYFDHNPTQWADSDLDGYGDNFANVSWLAVRPSEWPGQLLGMTPIQIVDIDTFPLDPEQWNDSDGDWYGDEPFTSRSDGCPYIWGNSSWDRIGCPDSDGDGFSDPGNAQPGEGVASPHGDADAFVDNPSQWWDSDGDGFGDNRTGTRGDACPGMPGSSEWAIEWNQETESYIDIEWLGCPDNDGDGYANSGEAFPNDPTQHVDTDGDGYNRNSEVSSCGDDPEGNNPDLFPLDGTQCDDRDGDGFGDNPSGPNGDWFPDDPTQWHDSDADGFGDNLNGTNGDICPFLYGSTNTEEARGCPDSDNDGVPDPQDAFPNDPFQDTDTDGDGYGDSNLSMDGDDCVYVFGTSHMGSIYGCPDSDGDGWADSLDDIYDPENNTNYRSGLFYPDAFVDNSTQWEDADLDGCGDNYTFVLELVDDPENEGLMIELRVQSGDAFPNDDSQCSDQDGDGYGDNESGRNSDKFPLRQSQWKDPDLDGYGYNGTLGAYQSDLCRGEKGFSFEDRFGCPDVDSDGWSDLADACPYDPDIHLIGQPCVITEPEDPEAKAGDEDSNMMPWLLGGVITFMLMLIFVALVAKQMGAHKRLEEIRVYQDQELAFASEETERRERWIEHYLAAGDLEKAKELGYVDKADWQVHMEEEKAEAASLPDIDDLF